jgi:hypothetical protein
MRSIHRLVGAGLAGLLLLGATASAAAATNPTTRTTRTPQVTVYGLTTSNKIVTFSLDRPDKVRNSVRVRGLGNDETLIGIDRRPKNDTVYGVTRSGSGAELITVDPATGRTTFVATLVTAPTATAPGRASIDLDGREFGFDFNPAADALRIVSDTGQNLRVIPEARTAPDGTALNPGDTFTDGTLNVGGVTETGITGAAYTNNDNDPATATTLYDIDHSGDRLFVQNPPNNGTLTTPVPLGKATGRRVGFDIRTVAGQPDLAVASLSTNGRRSTRIAVVDLATGRVQVKGTFRKAALRDIALAR